MDNRTQATIMEIFQRRMPEKVISSMFDFRFGNAEIVVQGDNIGLISLYNVSEECFKINVVFTPTGISTVAKTLVIRAKIDIYDESDFV